MRINWVMPFVVLLPRASKCNLGVLSKVAARPRSGPCPPTHPPGTTAMALGTWPCCSAAAACSASSFFHLWAKLLSSGFKDPAVARICPQVFSSSSIPSRRRLARFRSSISPGMRISLSGETFFELRT